MIIVSILADYTFTAVVKDNFWQLSIEKLSNDIIDNEVALILHVTAEIPDKTSPAETTIVVTLPKKISSTAIYFEENVYYATYDSDNNLTIDKDIKLDRDLDGLAVVSTDGW